MLLDERYAGIFQDIRKDIRCQSVVGKEVVLERSTLRDCSIMILLSGRDMEKKKRRC